MGLAARVQPGVRVEETGPTVQAIAARAALQATSGLVASADVVPLLAGNYFPPVLCAMMKLLRRQTRLG